MKEICFEEFKNLYEDFYHKYDDYLTIRGAIWNSYLSDKRQEEVIGTLNEMFKGYTDPFAHEEYTEVTEQYIDTFMSRGKEIYKELISHKGQLCSVENGANGIFVKLVATFEDYYYVIDMNGKIYFETAVSKIEFL